MFVGTVLWHRPGIPQSWPNHTEKVKAPKVSRSSRRGRASVQRRGISADGSCLNEPVLQTPAVFPLNWKGIGATPGLSKFFL